MQMRNSKPGATHMILQKSIPHNPLAENKLPGIAPLQMADWLQPDEAFAGQMAEREALLAAARDQVLQLDPAAFPAAQELLQLVLDHRYGGARDQVTRPDGVTVSLAPDLHAPRLENAPRDDSHADDAPYMRSEQQVILRLPKTRAVIFSIHTYMVHKQDVMAQWGRGSAAR